jgi:hypothetical protein
LRLIDARIPEPGAERLERRVRRIQAVVIEPAAGVRNAITRHMRAHTSARAAGAQLGERLEPRQGVRDVANEEVGREAPVRE